VVWCRSSKPDKTQGLPFNLHNFVTSCHASAHSSYIVDKIAAQSTFVLCSLQSLSSARASRKAQNGEYSGIIKYHSSSNTNGNNYYDCTGVADRLLNRIDALHIVLEQLGGQMPDECCTRHSHLEDTDVNRWNAYLLPIVALRPR
jgi:hypothetical protein